MLEDQIRDALDRRVDVRDAFRGLPAEALNEMVEDIAKIVSAARGAARAELEAEAARFQAERAASLESFRRALCGALDIDREGLQDPAELGEAWSEVQIRACTYPVFARTAASFEGYLADASAALDAAGFPHVDGVSIAERIRALAR